jgi:hypothetical protein
VRLAKTTLIAIVFLCAGAEGSPGCGGPASDSTTPTTPVTPTSYAGTYRGTVAYSCNGAYVDTVTTDISVRDESVSLYAAGWWSYVTWSGTSYSGSYLTSDANVSVSGRADGATTSGTMTVTLKTRWDSNTWCFNRATEPGTTLTYSYSGR